MRLPGLSSCMHETSEKKHRIMPRSTAFRCITLHCTALHCIKIYSHSNRQKSSYKRHYFWGHKNGPSKHETLNQCWFNVGPPSTTLGQQQTNIGSASGVCWATPIMIVWLITRRSSWSGGYSHQIVPITAHKQATTVPLNVRTILKTGWMSVQRLRWSSVGGELEDRSRSSTTTEVIWFLSHYLSVMTNSKYIYSPDSVFSIMRRIKSHDPTRPWGEVDNLRGQAFSHVLICFHKFNELYTNIDPSIAKEVNIGIRKSSTLCHQNKLMKKL